jgi:hypothetical protein
VRLFFPSLLNQFLGYFRVESPKKKTEKKKNEKKNQSQENIEAQLKPIARTLPSLSNSPSLCLHTFFVSKSYINVFFLSKDFFFRIRFVSQKKIEKIEFARSEKNRFARRQRYSTGEKRDRSIAYRQANRMNTFSASLNARQQTPNNVRNRKKKKKKAKILHEI